MARTQQDTFRLWPGDYFDPIDPWYPLDVFLAAIDEVRPDVAGSLRNEYMPGGGLCVAPEDALVALSRMVLQNADPEQLDPDPRAIERVWRPALKWAVRYHLIQSTEAFIEAYRSGLTPEGAYHRDLMELVCFSMSQWSSLMWKGTYSQAWIRMLRPCRWEVMQVKDGEIHRSKQGHDQIVINVPRIDLTRETEQDAEERYSRAFKAEFERLRAAARDRMEERGTQPVPARVEHEHFKWLAMFQVNEKSKNSIRKEVGKTWGAVHSGILRAAELLVGKEYRERWLRQDEAATGGS